MEDLGLNLDNIIIDDSSNDNIFDNILDSAVEIDKKDDENLSDKDKEVIDTGKLLEEETGEDISDKTVNEDKDKELTEDKDKDKEDESKIKGNGNSPFASVANAFKEDGILSNLSEDDLKNIKTAEDFSAAIEKEIQARFDDRTKRVNEALDNGVEPEVIKQNENIISYLNNLSDEALNDESENGVKLRTNLIVQDYLNKGFTQERAVKEANKSITAGSDLEDAKEALEANKIFYSTEYNKLLQDAKNESEKERLATVELHKNIEKTVLNDEDIIKGLTLTKDIRKQTIDNIQKPIYTDKDGNRYSAIQKYEKENPAEFMAKIGLLYTMTNGFKDMDKIITTSKTQVKKSAIKELEQTLLSNTTLGGEMIFANSLGSDDQENDKGEFILDI